MPTRLERHILTITKDKDISDKAQIPANAQVDYYRQGARVAAAVTVPSHGVDDTAISVRDVGRIQPMDMLGVNGINPANLRVTAIMSPTQLMVSNTSSSAISLAAGDRLIPSGNRPTSYKESTGAESQGSAASTDANTGILNPSYLTERFVDAIVTDNGTPAFAPRVLVDQLSGALSFIDVRDYGTIQAAIDACPQGGAVYIPAGSWDLDVHGEGGTLKVRESQHQSGLTIYGDGWGTELVMSADTSKNGIEIITASPPMGNHTIRELRIRGRAPNQTGAGHCIHVDGTGGLALAGVLVDYSPGDAIWLNNVSYATLTQCWLGVENGARIQGCGIKMTTCFQALLLGSTVVGTQEECLHATNSFGTVIVGGAFSDGQGNQTGKGAEASALFLDGCYHTTLINPSIGGFVKANSKTAIRCLNNQLGNVVGCRMEGVGPVDTGSVGLDLDGSAGFVIEANLWAYLQTAIKVRDGCYQITVLTQLMDTGKTGPTLIQLPSITARDGRHIIVMDRLGIIPPVLTTVDPVNPPDGALWYRGGGTKGWYGWNGTNTVQLG